ncbi:MAG: efflux RND transporter periplasmic adaptor subunit [Burkholderiaceae bacterium]
MPFLTPTIATLPLAVALGLGALPVLAASPLAVQTVQTSASGQTLTLDGRVEAVRDTSVAAPVPGTIVAVLVRVGDRVQAGQELLRVDARAAAQNAAASAAQVDAARASLEVASREYERQVQLHQKQYISQAALDRAQAQWQAARAQVQALQAQANAASTQSGLHTVRAPYAGVVVEVPAQLGDMALPGKPLMRVFDPAQLRVTVDVPRTAMGPLPTGTLTLNIPGTEPGQWTVDATRATWVPAVDAATHTMQLRVPLPTDGKGIVPGMFARVTLQAAGAGDAASRVFVPRSAVLRRAEMTGVYVVDAEGRPSLRQVRLGRERGGDVEVLSGLRAGERVATDAAAATAQLR